MASIHRPTGIRSSRMHMQWQWVTTTQQGTRNQEIHRSFICQHYALQCSHASDETRDIGRNGCFHGEVCKCLCCDSMSYFQTTYFTHLHWMSNLLTTSGVCIKILARIRNWWRCRCHKTGFLCTYRWSNISPGSEMTSSNMQNQPVLKSWQYFTCSHSWVKRDMRMGLEWCRPRRGRQQVKRYMRMGCGVGRGEDGSE